MLSFENLRTLPPDGGILIEPMVSQWPRLIENNLRLASKAQLTLAGNPVEQVRQATRLACFGQQYQEPIIASGHQPEFIHPGVWAKQVVVHDVADKFDMMGVELVVDSDSADSFALVVPTAGSDGVYRIREIEPITLPGGAAYEGRPRIGDSDLEAMRRQLQEAFADNLSRSLMPAYLNAITAATEARDFVQQHLAGRETIDAVLSVQLGHLRVSEAFGGAFVADLLLNAERFATAYNQSLAEYRRRERVRGANRPLPDLNRQVDRTETPLWIYQYLKPRRRLHIERRSDRILCYADDELVGTLSVAELTGDADAALADLRPWVVRPRALTLTLWARLLVCDLFVHGIGGAKYDRITDAIFRRYYRCEPTAFTCVSATLRLPLARYSSTASDLAAARRQRRDFYFNPQRYIPDIPVELLIERNRLIQESDRLREMRGPSGNRRKIFLTIRDVNDRLVKTRPDIQHKLTERVTRISREVESNKIADAREYFYALHSRERLSMLAARLADAVENARLPN